MGINIASQLNWINLLYEVAYEAMLLPLYFLIGASKDNRDEFRNKVSSAYVVIFLVYAAFSICVNIFAEPLCYLMAQNPTLITESVEYIRLETLASIFATMIKYSVLLLLLLGKSKFMYFITIVQVFLAILFDTLLISRFDFSMDLGVKGIAISNIITNALILLGVMFYIRQELKLSFKNLSYNWLKDWIKLGKYSCFESLIRNLSFSWMIIRMVNLIQEQGNYWIANNFIWGFLLVPILALSELIKRNAAIPSASKRLMPAYIKLTIIIVIIWIISMPSWPYLLQNIMNVQNYNTVLYLIYFQLIFYIVFAFNSIMTAVLYGRGKTKYLFYRSICIDLIYYGFVFILYLNGLFSPSLKTISIIFGCGMILNVIPTIYFYLKTIKEEPVTTSINLNHHSAYRD